MKKQNKQTSLILTLLSIYFLYSQTILLNVAVAGGITPLKSKVISSKENLTCLGYSDGAMKKSEFGGSGPINNPDFASGQFFEYARGRLYYKTCHFNFGEMKEESYGFVEWESKDRKTTTIVTLLKKPGFCFRATGFNLVNADLLITLSTCDGEKNKEGFGYLNMTYRWVGTKFGKGNFVLKNETYKKNI